MHSETEGVRRWTLFEGFDPAGERGVEGVLAVSNGYVGTRAAVEEGHPASFPLTVVAGTYDPARPAEDPPPDPNSAPSLVALPDWAALRIWLDDEELRLDHGATLLHERRPDHGAGQTVRYWQHRLPSGRLVHAAFHRVASLADRHALVQQVVLALPEDSAQVRLAAALEVPSLDRHALPYLSRPVLEPPTAEAPAAVVLTGARSSLRVALAQHCALAGDAGDGMSGPSRPLAVERSRHGVTEWWAWTAEPEVTYRWDRLVVLHTSLDSDEPRAAATARVGRLGARGGERAIEEHRSHWRQRWEAGAVELHGDELTAAALRSATHHLTMAANPEDDRASVPARGLTGEIYRGHVMWDTEIYLMPFYSFTWPEAARSMLLYRHRGLAEARARARRFGYAGALYPWEAAGTAEGTPALDRDWKGTETELRTWRRAHHVSAAVAYATWLYWQVSGDDDFFASAGAEMVLEVARFWASRVEPGGDGNMHIRGAMGPDEYHERVDDSSYTNWMAAYCLDLGRRTARWASEERPALWAALERAMGLEGGEVAAWEELSETLVGGQRSATGVIEQFAGYFELEDVELPDHDGSGRSAHDVFGREGVAKTQITKQADVVLLCHLLWDEVGPDAAARNLDYYEPRCDHASSLSLSIHAAVAARLGRSDQALGLLRGAAALELGDNVAKAQHGIHLANDGGVWQAVVLGFAGLRATADAVSLEPRLPQGWELVRIPFEWRRRRFVAELRPVGDGGVEVHLRQRGTDAVRRHWVPRGGRFVIGADS